MKRWNIKQTEISDSALRAVCEETGLSRPAAYVLATRGFNTPEKAKEFLGLAEDEIINNGIFDPFLISDMEKAAEIIKSALLGGEKIVVFGDYDCDGVTSTVMLVQYLTAQGGEVDWYIPSRDEGYGLNTAAIDLLAEKGADVIITVDNGISAVEEAAYIKQTGMRLIITDHHTPPAVLPDADAVINPKRDGDKSSFKELAGCGVVLKLIMALENDTDSVLEQFSDLAALGTVGDIVPLTGENRVIVRRGLEIMPCTENMGLYKLLRQSGFLSDDDSRDRLTAGALSFTACPRINAAGRFAHASKAAELLLAENEPLAELRANELTALNNARREEENEILKQAEMLFAKEPERLSERVLVLKGAKWHSGVTGIVASRLLKYGKPVIIISDDGETLKASARSIEAFPLMPLLEACSDLLEKFGGHVKAAGFTAKSENFSALEARIKAYSAAHFPQMPFDVIHIDKVLCEEDLTLENVEGLKKLAPCGEENPLPVFLMQNCVILSKKPLKDGKYISFNVRMGSVTQKILYFNCTYNDFCFENGQAVDLLVTLELNEYNGITSVSAQCKDIRPSGFQQEKTFAALRTYEALIRGEAPDPALITRIIPEKDDIKIIYDILRKFGENQINILRVYYEAVSKNLNYCKFRIIIDILAEFKLITFDIINGAVLLLPVSGVKANLDNSETLSKIKTMLNNCINI
ncbi:MAG: single-stranded-DNA-specific exonuclease RecJ [Oscillospiraceae bacterium]|nr:single-stranded-DNA-specific exonuclease RecJ [Oscillospiraceae bacterium]